MLLMMTLLNMLQEMRNVSAYLSLKMEFLSRKRYYNIKIMNTINDLMHTITPGRVAQSVGHLTRKSGGLGSIPGLATYFRFSFCFFKKGSCQLLAKVCAGSTG